MQPDSGITQLLRDKCALHHLNRKMSRLTFGIFKSKLSEKGAFHRIAFQTDEIPPPCRRTDVVGRCLDGGFCRIGDLAGRDEVITEVGSDGISLTLLPFQNVVRFMKSLMRRSITTMVDESCDGEKVDKMVMIQ